MIISTENGSVEQELSDYRDVEGVKVPFTIRTVANGVQQSMLTIEKVEFNVKSRRHDLQARIRSYGGSNPARTPVRGYSGLPSRSCSFSR